MLLFNNHPLFTPTFSHVLIIKHGPTTQSPTIHPPHQPLLPRQSPLAPPRPIRLPHCRRRQQHPNAPRRNRIPNPPARHRPRRPLPRNARRRLLHQVRRGTLPLPRQTRRRRQGRGYGHHTHPHAAQIQQSV